MIPDRGAVTVDDLLAARLREPRVHHLTVAAARVAAAPLDVVLPDLLAALSGPLTPEDCRRLHVLISTLYHRAGAPLALTTTLRAAIEAARTNTREGVI
jgi:hypothetical protein